MSTAPSPPGSADRESPPRRSRRLLWSALAVAALAAALLLLLAQDRQPAASSPRAVENAPQPEEGDARIGHLPASRFVHDRDRWLTALDPHTAPAAEAAWVVDDDEVFGVVVAGHPRAYPLTRIALRHAVNDTIDGTRILVTYCILCSAAVAFDPVVAGERLTFGLLGSYRGTATLYDHQTNSTWLQVTGECVAGAHAGVVLEQLPTGRLTSWREWRTTHPGTDVMGGEAPGVEGRRDEHFARETVRRGTWFLPPEIRPTVDLSDDRLRPNDLLLGVVVGEHARAYPLSSLRVALVVEDRVGATSVSAWFDPSSGSCAAYDRRLADRLLHFEATGTGGVRDRETGSRWTLDGLCVEGRLEGAALTSLRGHVCEWYGWRALHEHTTIWAPR